MDIITDNSTQSISSLANVNGTYNPFITASDLTTSLASKQDTLTANTNLLGVGSSISALDYGKITLNVPQYFPTSWGNVSGKPTDFPSSWANVSGKPTDFQANWNTTITNKPDLTIYYNKNESDAKFAILANNNTFAGDVIINGTAKTLSFGSRAIDNLIYLFGTTYGLGINTSTFRLNAPADASYKFYTGTTNTMTLNTAGLLSTTGGITLTTPAKFTGDGSGLTNLPLTNYYIKSEVDTLLNTKQPNLTFSSPLTNTANTVSINLSSYQPLLTFSSPLSKSAGNAVSIDLSAYQPLLTFSSPLSKSAGNAVSIDLTSYLLVSTASTTYQPILTFNTPLSKSAGNAVSIDLTAYAPTTSNDLRYLRLDGTNSMTKSLIIASTISEYPIDISTTNSASPNCIKFKSDTTNYAYIGVAGTTFGGNYQNNLFLETTNSIVFNTGGIISGGTPRMIIMSSGNVGIGTNNAANILQVGNAGRLRISNGTTDYSLLGTLDTDGASNTRIVVSGNTRSGFAGNIEYYSTSTGNHIFYTTNTNVEKMRLYSTGNLNVNTIVIDRGTYDHSTAPLTATHQTPTSNISAYLNDPQPILNLCRQGKSEIAYGARATFSLSRYENNGVNSRTRMDISMAHTGYDNVNVMTLYSSGNVGIGTINPLQKLHIDSGALHITGNTASPATSSSASFWNQAGVGPTIAGANFSVQTGGTPAEAFKVNSDGQVITNGYIFAGGLTNGIRINGNDYGNTFYQDASTIGGQGANVGFTLRDNNSFKFQAFTSGQNPNVYTTMAEINMNGISLNKPTTVSGNVNINNNGKLIFNNNIDDMRIQLWTGYGFGINSGTLRYNSDTNHTFYAASSAFLGTINSKGLLLNSADYNTGGTKGIFFRNGYDVANNNNYNCSILTYDHNGDTFADGLSINGYDGVSFCTGGNVRQERMKVKQDGNININNSLNIGTTLTGATNVSKRAYFTFTPQLVNVSGVGLRYVYPIYLPSYISTVFAGGETHCNARITIWTSSGDYGAGILNVETMQYTVFTSSFSGVYGKCRVCGIFNNTNGSYIQDSGSLYSIYYSGWNGTGGATEKCCVIENIASY